MGDPLARVVAVLKSKGCDPRKRGTDSYEARCPAHKGDRHNLSVGLGDKGVVLCCHHVGENGHPSCTTEDIVGAVGLTLADLFDDGSSGDGKPKRTPKTYPTPEAAAAAVAYRLKVPGHAGLWTYHDTHGKPAMVVARFNLPDGSKEFRPFSPCPGGWRIGEPGGLIPLFNLSAIAGCKGDAIYVVEGEKCAEVLGRFMPFVTSAPFGAGKANKSDWTPLAGKVVAIVPDNDAPGAGHVRSVLAELAKLDPRPTVRVLWLPDLAEGEDVADWLPRVVGDRQGDEAVKVVRLRLRTMVGEAEDTPLDAPAVPQGEPGGADDRSHDHIRDVTAGEAVEPQPEDFAAVVLPEWPDPPEDVAFSGLAGRVVRLIEPHTEADEAGLLLQFLIGFGNALGAGLFVMADGHAHHANEFAVCVGETSRARKGTAWRRVHPILAELDPEWNDARIVAGLSSGEGLIYEVRDPMEGKDDPGVIDKRLQLIETEFGNPLRVFAREGNTLSGILRMAWDGDALRTLTKNSPIKATNTHISLIGHITAEELKKYLAHVEVFNGLGNRILWGCVRRSKRLPFGGAVPAADLAAVGSKLALSAAAARAVGAVGWTPAARALWESEYDNLTADRPGLWGAITSRAEAHVLRLSLIYAALDGASTIDDTHILAALAVWRYCDRSALHLFGGSVGDRLADTIRAALRSRSEGMTRTDIRDLFGRNETAEEIARALGLLLRYGLATRKTTDTGGRPSERWHAAGVTVTTTTKTT